MSVIRIDLVGWIPNAFKQQIVDELVTLLADQAKSALGDEVSEALKRLRSDAAFQDAVDQGLREATDRFVREYMEEDEDLVSAIARDPDFWKAKSVRQALLEIIKHPGVYLGEERMTLARSFVDVLHQRINRERVDRAVIFFLRCLAEELWTLPELQPIYALQFQRMTAEAARQQVALQKAQLRATTGLSADLRDALLHLTDTLAEQKALPEPESPALPEHPQVYHNLPQPDYGRFIGRQEELAQVHRILRPYPHSRHPLVTIDGIGGIGKSALALEVAHRYLRDYDRLPEEERFDAIIWTSAKASVLTADGIAPRQQIARTLDDIYIAIAVTLEREDITRARPEAQDELVAKALTRQRTLLIVDNLETVDDERVNAFLRELPAPTKAVVTTRHRIDVAYPIRLTGMPQADALDLISQECEKKGVTLTDTEAEKLYQRTGGVPLAMVWSVAQMGYGYGVDSVLRRLGEPSSDIVRFCFENCIEKIRNTDSYKILVASSLFVASASRRSLGYVAGLHEDILSRDEGLVNLEKLSLVYHKGGRFFTPPLVRTYMLNRIASQTLREFRKRYTEWYKSMLLEWKKSPYQVMRHFAIECENLLGAIDWELSPSGNFNNALVLIRKSEWFLFISGQWKRLTTYLTRITEDLVELGILPGQPELLNYLGGIFYLQGDHTGSIEAKSHALKIAEKLEDNAWIAQTSSSLAEIYAERGNSLKADRFLRMASEAIAHTKDLGTQVKVKRRLARMHLLRGEFDLAERLIEEALDLLKQSNRSLEEVAGTEWWMGVMAIKKGKFAEARTYLTQSLIILEQYPTINLNIGGARKWMAILEEKEQNYEQALANATEALNIFSRLGMQMDVNQMRELIARVKFLKQSE